MNKSIENLCCFSFRQMEDPSLLEESSILLDPNEVGRAAPLRLGSVLALYFDMLYLNIKLFKW